MYRYGENGIKHEEIMKYIEAILHKHLNMINVELVLNNVGEVHGKYRLTIDEKATDGTYKIHKVYESIFGNTETLIARFWVLTNSKDISPKHFISPPVLQYTDTSDIEKLPVVTII
jgi:hypothetical protein